MLPSPLSHQLTDFLSLCDLVSTSVESAWLMSHIWMMSQPDSSLHSHLGNLRRQEWRWQNPRKCLLGSSYTKKHTFHCFCISQCRAGLELKVACWYVQISILLSKLNCAKELFHALELKGPYLKIWGTILAPAKAL